MWIYIILGVILVLFIIFFALYIVAKYELKALVIRITTAEKSVDKSMKEKVDKLISINDFLNKKKCDISFNGIDELKDKDIDNFELNEELAKYDQTINELANYNKDIEFTEDELKELDELHDINIDTLASQKYYNANVLKYNKLIKSFPANIIAKAKHYKVKDIYSSKKEEIFEILKK